jgi:hypothetical protein
VIEMRDIFKTIVRLAANPYVEFAVGVAVVVSGIWQLVYELPGEIAAEELEGHHAIVLFGFFLAINSFLRFFKGLEQAGRAAVKLTNGRVEGLLRPVKRFMDHWCVEFSVGLILVVGGFAELFEEFLGLDKLGDADNDYLWFAALLIIGTSMLVKSLAGAIDVLKFAHGVNRHRSLRMALISRLESLFRKPVVEASLASAILLVGIVHELADSTALGVEAIEAHHGLVAIGAQHLLKVSQDVSDSLELAEDAAEEDVS